MICTLQDHGAEPGCPIAPQLSSQHTRLSPQPQERRRPMCERICTIMEDDKKELEKTSNLCAPGKRARVADTQKWPTSNTRRKNQETHLCTKTERGLVEPLQLCPYKLCSCK